MSNLRSLVQEMANVRATLDRLDATRAENQKLYDELRLIKIPQAMEEEGVDRITYDGIGTVSLRTDVRASIPAASRDKAWEWLLDEGWSDLITSTVNASTLKAWAKERLAEGDHIPDGLFKILPYEYAVITKR